MKNVALENSEWGEVLYSLGMVISTRKEVSLKVDHLEKIVQKIREQIYPNLEKGYSAGDSK